MGTIHVINASKINIQPKLRLPHLNFVNHSIEINIFLKEKKTIEK